MNTVNKEEEVREIGQSPREPGDVAELRWESAVDLVECELTTNKKS